MSSLRIDINGRSYSDKYCGIDIGYEQNVLNATVFVDGSDLINHFSLTCDMDWVKIKRLRNSIELVVAKNNTLSSRIAGLTFTHNLDKNVYINLNITQAACDYYISVDKTQIIFDTLLDEDDADKEVCDVIVTTTNGIEDFGIGSIVEKVDVGLNGNDGDDYTIKYDNGLKLTKVNTNLLRITNYGRVFLEDNSYYIITLYHKNNPRSTAKIEIRYTDSGTNNELGFDFRDDQ